MEQPNFPKNIGILGGGQLARMLAQAAQAMGLSVIAYASHADDPASQICPGSVVGRPDDRVSLRRFLSQVDLVVFENEFFPYEPLRDASLGLGVRFAPGLPCMLRLRDKWVQKRALSRLGIPTADFSPFRARGKAVAVELRRLERKWAAKNPSNSGIVLKWAQQGYDGKGICILGARDWDSLGVQKFLDSADQKGVIVFAERRISFRRELAIAACRTARGDFLAYPLVVSEQENGICRKVMGPARNLGVSPVIEASAVRAASQVARHFGLIGTFAIEFFEEENGQLSVNEIAPRVHNSAHYTQDACLTSQFENHWRAVLGWTLGSTRSAEAFAMLNILGTSAGAPLTRCPELTSEMHFHWYGKAEWRPGRKLGHINWVSDSPGDPEPQLGGLEKLTAHWLDPGNKKSRNRNQNQKRAGK